MIVESIPASSCETACGTDLHEHYAGLLLGMSGEPWRDPSFDAGQLAALVGLTEERVQEVLRRMVRQDSEDFIDRYRANAATHLLSARPRPALKQVASWAGFPNLSRFHDAMVEFTQTTPLRYLALLEKQETASLRRRC